MKFSSVEPADRDNMAILIVYLVPLLKINLDNFNWWLWLFIIGIIVILLSASNSYPMNPLMYLIGWHSFRASTKEGITYILVTKRRMQNVTQSLTVVQLTDYILIDVGGSQ